MAARDEIIKRARKYGLDPAAVLAVARGEGGLVNREGDVGDLGGGGSYGPFQLYAQGALPKQFKGRPKQADAWAWSPAGIDYALRKMAEAGASGLTGKEAVSAIVTKFERPADPKGSIAKAIARLPSVNLGATSVASNGPTAAPPEIPGMMTINDIFKKVGLPTLEGIGETRLGGKPQPMVSPVQPQAPKGKVAPLPKVQRMIGLIEYAQQLGLSVRENPYTDPVDASVHVKGSHHTQVIGKANGKKVGRAIDVSGEPAKMKAFFQYAEQFKGMGLDDLFYDPMGYSYDQGRRWDKTIGGHGDHVHLSVR